MLMEFGIHYVLYAIVNIIIFEDDISNKENYKGLNTFSTLTKCLIILQFHLPWLIIDMMT